MFNKQEFETLILIYAAHIDYEFHHFEKKHIIDLYGQDSYDKMLGYYEQSKPKAFELILKEFRLIYSSEEDKAELKKKLMKLFLVDLEYSVFEKGFIKFYDTLCSK